MLLSLEYLSLELAGGGVQAGSINVVVSIRGNYGKWMSSPRGKAQDSVTRAVGRGGD